MPRMLSCWVLLLSLIVVPTQLQAQSMSDLRTVTVQGEAELVREPDQAVVRFGVVTEAQDPEEARRLNAEAAAAAMNVVRDLGIAERKITLETLSLQPQREYDQENRRWIERGYEAQRQVSVEIDDLEELPLLVARVVQQGANRLAGIAYGLQDQTSVRQDALREAVLNARAKAELMATTAGATLGPVQSMTEQAMDMPRPVYTRAMLATASKDAAPEPDAYAAGEITVRTTVQVTFQLQ